MVLDGMWCENNAWYFDLIQLTIGDAVEFIGTEEVLDRVLDAIERGGDEALATIIGVVLAIVRVDGNDANGYITLGGWTSDSSFCWGDGYNFCTLRDEVLVWVGLWCKYGLS